MKKFPDFSMAFDYENGYYLTCSVDRIKKLVAQLELFRKSLNVSGNIVECGVFKGVSFSRLALFRDVFSQQQKKLIGFDTFKAYYDGSSWFPDDALRVKNLTDNAGTRCITKEQMTASFMSRSIFNFELIEGDVLNTIPKYVRENARMRISFLHLDLDFYEPSLTALKYLFPMMSVGGIVMFDDYGVYDGETLAINEYLGKDFVRKEDLYGLGYVVKE